MSVEHRKLSPGLPHALFEEFQALCGTPTRARNGIHSLSLAELRKLWEFVRIFWQSYMRARQVLQTLYCSDNCKDSKHVHTPLLPNDIHKGQPDRSTTMEREKARFSRTRGHEKGGFVAARICRVSNLKFQNDLLRMVGSCLHTLGAL